MRIESSTASVNIHGLALSAGLRLEELRKSAPIWFRRPLIANGSYETYRLADSEAASHLVFQNGLLWQVRICLIMKEDANGQVSEQCERIRHGRQEAEMLSQLGSTSLRCPNGNSVELCFDERTPASSIIITYPIPDSPPSTPRG
jgi:hypothetical protein